MPEQHPHLQVTQSFRGAGTLLSRDISVPVAAFTLTRDSYSLSSPWAFVAHFLADHGAASDRLMRSGRPDLSFRGIDSYGRDIFIPALHWRHKEHTYLEAEADEVVLGDVPVPRPPERQWVTVFLSPTPLALPEKPFLVRSWTGEIKPFGENERAIELPVIPSTLGDLAFSIRYVYEDIAVGRTDATARIPIPGLHTEIPTDRRSGQPLSAARGLMKELEPLLRLLSFLSREHVRCTGIAVNSFNFGSDANLRHNDLVIHRSRVLTDGSGSRDPLIVAPRLPPGAYKSMLVAFKALPFHDAASTAMLYLVESLRATYVDVSFINAFTAFEAILTALAEDSRSAKILPSGRFDRLATFLRNALRSEEARLSSEEAEMVASKLPELNRPAILVKAATLLRHHRVPVDDLWAPGTSLEEGLSGPIRRRNSFLHAGAIPSGLQLRLDAIRIHTITERLLYILLGGDSDWIHPQAYHRTEDLLRMEAALAGSEQ